jgi:hypothetical protein
VILLTRHRDESSSHREGFALLSPVRQEKDVFAAGALVREAGGATVGFDNGVLKFGSFHAQFTGL